MTTKTSETSMKDKCPMYIYATEMINEYYALFNMKNKNVLTICGSGDQVLNALFLGAKKVTGFDLNIYSKHILNLKIASVLSLNLKEFLKFFGDQKINMGFDYKLYKKIKENLSNETRAFFDRIYDEFNFNGDKLAKSSHFRKRAGIQERTTREFNLYLKDEKSYLKMKEILKEKRFDFVLGSVLDISKIIKFGKYEIINLSNVQNYVCLNLNEKETLKCFHKKVLLPLSKLLKRDNYIFYYTRDENSYPNPVRKNSPTLTKKSNIKFLSSLGKFDIKQKSFKGFKKKYKDKIVIFRKKF